MTGVRTQVRGQWRLRRDTGTTIVELAVVMLILSVIVAATVTLSIGFSRANAENVNRQDQIDMARSAVERMSKTIRTAVKPSQLTCSGCTEDAFVRGDDFAVQFYANLDNPDNLVGPSRITYTIADSGPEAGILVEKVQRPDSNTPSPNYTYCNAESPSAPSGCKERLAVRHLATGVQLDTGRPVFQYFDDSGKLLDPPAGGLSVANLQKVLSIELTVTVQSTEPTKPNPTTYIQRVMLPNSDAILRPPKEL
jgi:type II secretory pathway pseudopilin PulG